MTKRTSKGAEEANFMIDKGAAPPATTAGRGAAYVGLAAVQLSYCVWHARGRVLYASRRASRRTPREDARRGARRSSASWR